MASRSSYFVATRADKTSTFYGNFIMKKDLTIEGDFVFGDVAADTFTVNGIATFNTDVDMVFDDDENLTITTTDTTAGASAPLVMTTTLSGAGVTGGRALFHTKFNIAAGAWVNALKGYTEITGTSGYSSGLCSAVVAEMKFAAKAGLSGAYYPLEIEVVCPATFSVNGNSGSNAGFIYARVSGTTDNWEDEAWFMFVPDLTAASGNMLSANSQTLRCAFGTSGTPVERYMVFSQAEDYLSLVGSSTNSGITLTGTFGASGTGAPAIQVGTSSTGIVYAQEEGAINTAIYSNYTGITGFFRGLYVESVYTPSTAASGEASVYGIRAKVTLATGCTNLESSSERMVGVDGCFENKGTVNGAGLWIAGTRGALFGAGTWTNVKFVSAVLGACQITSSVSSGIYSAFAAYSTSTTPDTVMNVHGTFTTFANFTNAATCIDETNSEGARNGRIAIADANGDTKYLLLYDAA